LSFQFLTSKQLRSGLSEGFFTVLSCNFQCRFGRFLAWHSKPFWEEICRHVALPASRCKKSPFPLGKILCTEINLGRLNPWILGACQPHCQEMADSRDLSLHIGFWWFLMLEYVWICSNQIGYKFCAYHILSFLNSLRTHAMLLAVDVAQVAKMRSSLRSSWWQKPVMRCDQWYAWNMDDTTYGGFLKGYPQIIHLYNGFSWILGYHHLWTLHIAWCSYPWTSLDIDGMLWHLWHLRVSHGRCRRHQRQRQDTLLIALDAEWLIPCILTAPCERDLA
jgi:hypothetical protein